MKLRQKRSVFSSRRKVSGDSALQSGSSFHVLAAATGNAQSPGVDRRVDGTSQTHAQSSVQCADVRSFLFIFITFSCRSTWHDINLVAGVFSPSRCRLFGTYSCPVVNCRPVRRKRNGGGVFFYLKSGPFPTKWNETESNFAGLIFCYFTFYLFGGRTPPPCLRASTCHTFYIFPQSRQLVPVWTLLFCSSPVCTCTLYERTTRW